MVKTERLYYDNPYLLEFDATVVGRLALGDRLGIIMDRTAFYPTSGGQPHDLGVINEVPVVDCYEDDSGALIHVLDGAVDIGPAHGRVDGSRRRDHMQQHSGQHVLSQAFVELFNWPTVSFHLGPETCTIDLPVDSVSRDQADKAEALANRVIGENRSVAVCYVDSEKIAEVGLRKPTERAGEVRVIEIAGFDKSACGGTHVRMTGEIGPLLITRIERAKRQTRVEFICGGRVIRFARDAGRVVDGISQILSCRPLQSAAAVKTLWDELQQSRKRISDLESLLIDHEAAAFPVADGLAVAAFQGRGIEALKLLAHKICLRPGLVALLADESDQLRLVFARSADSTRDVAQLLKRTLEKFGGRGGGSPSFAQGGGLTAPTGRSVLDYVVSLLR
jgi:alanyl-tRNA synthetase